MIVDSCGWLEFLTDGKLAESFATYLQNLDELVTPTIVIYEVYKKVKHERGEENAILIAGQMHTTNIVPLTSNIALLAADVSLKYRLPMADAIVYATSLAEKCKIVTSDSHFKELIGVIFIE